ncbi:acetoin reductase family protein [Macrolepiota fuliginosa MF-IS2]|uniref:Acetoin reductase family protein n=1 Tax=Macrolepiota fuliginosa MF-IS2 TaxID=1400762 RepID=A0A9P6C3K8_9AGAR|nr:acetoin reductase family protein [Macrolepiota fuliginosa MF-IS2]
MSNTRVAIVTGAAQGIGRAIAIRLADDGLDVAVNDLEAQRASLEEVQAIISAKGRRAFIFTGDVSDEPTVKSLVDSVVKALGGVDVMVANAGICFAKSVLDTTVEDWDRIFRINARSVFLSYKYAALQMIKQAAPVLGAYSGTKAAVRSITQAAALEWGAHGITVNCYAPGATDTPMTRALGEQFGTTSEVLFAEESKKTACGYIGKPSDMAAFVSYLASEESHFMTGVIGQWVTINGGRQFE